MSVYCLVYFTKYKRGGVSCYHDDKLWNDLSALTSDISALLLILWLITHYLLALTPFLFWLRLLPWGLVQSGGTALAPVAWKIGLPILVEACV